MINVGIIGTGFMAVAHIRAYRKLPMARIVALANPSGRNLDGDFSNVAGNVGSQDAVRLDMTQVRAYRRIEDLLARYADQLADSPAERERLRSGAVAITHLDYDWSLNDAGR